MKCSIRGGLMSVVSTVVLGAAMMLIPSLSWAGAKNVIVMVPDGCSVSIQTLARWYKGAPLASDEIVSGSVKTYMASSVITDSASASTAFATGYKTTDGFISVGPRAEDILSTLPAPSPEMPYKPLATVLEGASLMGKATGLVATSRITHATPAGFAAHIHDRNMENEIMENLVYEDIDVVFGGGKRHLLPKDQGGKREDGENLLQVLLDRGYQFVETRDQMMGLTSGKVWGLFASSHMSPDIDRAEFAPTEPSLAEMTQKAIQLLSQNENGFFLMVEGSQVDWAGHANDAIYMLTDFLAYDDAVKVALDFAKASGDTLLIAFPDHNTGGLALGSDTAQPAYTATTVEDLLAPLRGMKITSAGLAGKIGDDLSAENIKTNIQQWWGIAATDEDVNRILALINEEESSVDYAISEVIGRNHTVLGWTTHGHTGEDVPLWSYGPDRPVGLYDNTDLARIIARQMGFNLDQVNSRLFVEVTALGYQVDMTDANNPVIRNAGAELPTGKDILRLNGIEHDLEGIVVYASMTGKAYVPREALNLINGSGNLENIVRSAEAPFWTVSSGQCANFNSATGTLSIPCMLIDGYSYWLDLTPISRNPLQLQVTEGGLN